MKFFVVSDIHGYYDELIAALNEAGFDENNPEYYLVCCGDYIDRGPKPWEVIQYVYNLPRRILIRGNHEDLFEECCYRGFAYMHDVSNGTEKTIIEIAKHNPIGYGYFPEDCHYALKRTAAFRHSLVNYFETENYIFVHSWIPTRQIEVNPEKYTHIPMLAEEFNPEWRDGNEVEWSDARWGNPFKQAEMGLLPDKTVVFGHWHCSAGWAAKENIPEFGEGSNFSPFYGDGYIAIDGCTAYTHKVNVVVLEDNFNTNLA